MGTLRFFEEVVSFKIRRTFGFADYTKTVETAVNSLFFTIFARQPSRPVRGTPGRKTTVEYKRMKPLPLLLAVLLFGIGTSCTDRTDRHQKALEELDRIIERRDAYGRTKNLRIAARRDELAAAKDPRKRIALAEEIYKEYYNYDIDSAYHYARRMLALAQSYGDGTRINCARVYLAKTVLNGGMYGEAFRILHQVDTTRLAPENKSEYYNVYRSYLSKQLSGADPALKARYRDSLQFYNVLRIRNLPEGSVPRKELEAMMYCKAGEARKALDLLLPEYEAGIEDTHLRAMVAYRLALIYEQLGDADRRKEYLIRATADDLRTPVREGMALYTLAGLLLEEGDVERANRYINCSMEDALYCNYRSRMQQSSEMVQQIAGAYIDSLDAKRRAMGYVTIVVSLLVVVLLGSFFTILVYYRKIRQISAARLEMNHQLRELNEHIRSINGELRDANNIKDEYVGHYLSLCSRYIVRINDYRKLLLKVYKDGDCDALIRELRTKNPADAEYKEFLAIFDETFLHLFPDFVAHVNRLMTDAERFSPRQPRTLNTELRILALIRLGVTHSAKIAAILNCSVATIHTYRAQLRNAAIGDRNAFDDAIRRIDIAGAEPSQTA